MSDSINHPQHYNIGRFEAIDVLQDWFPNNPILWQVVKYLSRAEHKNDYLEDLNKAKWYLEFAIKDEIYKRNKFIESNPNCARCGCLFNSFDEIDSSIKSSSMFAVCKNLSNCLIREKGNTK